MAGGWKRDEDLSSRDDVVQTARQENESRQLLASVYLRRPGVERLSWIFQHWLGPRDPLLFQTM